MPDLLIPGTSGTKLLLDGSDIGWPGLLTAEAWLAGLEVFKSVSEKLGGPEAIVEILSMEHADHGSWKPTKTTLRKGGAITAGDVIRAAYNQIPNIPSFNYDWRGDIRQSGQLLAEKLVKEKPTNEKWRLVGHSQGGLVIVVASKILGTQGAADATAFSKLVSHVALVGCPLRGTLNAANAFISAGNLTADFSDYFRKIVKTWPAIHQMLPAWDVFDPGHGRTDNPPLFDPKVWSKYDLDESMLDRAREMQQRYLVTPLRFMADVKVRITMSEAQQTWNGMTRRTQDLVPSGAEPGDTLVPALTTRALMTDVERQASLLVGISGGVAEHSMLLNDPLIATDLNQFFAS